MMRQIMRVGLAASASALAGGLIASAVRPGPISRALITVGLSVLVAIPTTGVIGVLAAFVRAREWRFAAAAAMVLGLLGYTLVQFFY